MNCCEFEKLVLDLARDQLTDATAREQSLAHTKFCERCATRLADERALLAGVSAVVAELAGEGAPPRVEEALLAAFRAQVGATHSPTVISISGVNWSKIRWAAVAAGILVLLSMIAILWRSANTVNPSDKDQADLPAPAAKTDPRITPQLPTEPRSDREQVVVSQSEKKRSHSQVSREVVTQFFLLREGEDLTEIESLKLVRVELPGSAIKEVGIPIDLELTNTRVKADVVLGQDGLARAIRFVAQASETEINKRESVTDGNNRTN
jgi:hypothetical protein